MTASSSTAEPLVSVVTPFYNSEDFLAECIESVLAQTYGHFEYVLVDNQSTDLSVEIAASYACKDPRIRLLHTDTFLDQVQNYNGALRRISPAAKYMKMVQADDWIVPRCLVEMVELAEQNPRVGIVSSFTLRETEVHGSGLPISRPVISGREARRLHLLDGVYMFGSPTALLFRADIVRARDPFYTEGRFHEDTEAVYEILRDWDFGFVHQVLSFMRAQAESITGSTRSYDPHPLDRLILVKMYGREVLDPDEYAACLDEALTRYYRRLAEATLHRRGGGYWDYHRRGLATISEEIDRVRLLREAVPALLDWTRFTPMSAVRSIRRRYEKAFNGVKLP
jgi:glycosyltransferase involved in cell wall biosynthesis